MRANPPRCPHRTHRWACLVDLQLMEIWRAYSLSRNSDTVTPSPRWREGSPQQCAGSLHDPAWKCQGCGGSQGPPAGIVRLLWPLEAWDVYEVCSPGCGGEVGLDGTQIE